MLFDVVVDADTCKAKDGLSYEIMYENKLILLSKTMAELGESCRAEKCTSF